MEDSKDINASSGYDCPLSTPQQGLLNLDAFQTSLSPIKNGKLATEKGESNYLKDGGIEDVQLCHTNQNTESISVPVSSGLLKEPFCSSPCLGMQYLFFGDDLEHSTKCTDTFYSKNCHLDLNELEISSETTLETESTIELPTLVANNSLSVMEEYVPFLDTTSKSNGL
ncbi:hypothetical protein GDO81_019746 [Engystomops pustulosus]|uniref:Uncharacterized protein n=2 Tax=Engystomops pustulosus TaxID=76066 RepID=A0AAV6ZD13_ENGPU|nr:hypothetical protein GDO81_019746 [Engystomops pustulosus]